MMEFICFDLESQCSDTDKSFKMETIEIGAVRISTFYSPHDSCLEFEIMDDFQSFVKPVINPILTPFCKELTGITQVEVDSAERFPQVLNKFLSWCGTSKNETFILASWGFYDRNQLTKDCQYHKISFPIEFQNHISLKHLFSQKYKIKPCGMDKALQMKGLRLDGTHHRALDDTKNISKLFLDLF